MIARFYQLHKTIAWLPTYDKPFIGIKVLLFFIQVYVKAYLAMSVSIFFINGINKEKRVLAVENGAVQQLKLDSFVKNDMRKHDWRKKLFANK